ncbi:MAG: TfoX/Sxy family protein [Prevotella sp.]|nr:TfoX/Sxy family protein [Prevotella sp.]
MACTQDFICRQLTPVGEISWRKMMGDYVIYANGKCVITACNGICYVKKHPAIETFMQDAECGFPYTGAKEHYILDIEHSEHAIKIVTILQEVLPFPKRRAINM